MRLQLYVTGKLPVCTMCSQFKHCGISQLAPIVILPHVPLQRSIRDEFHDRIEHRRSRQMAAISLPFPQTRHFNRLKRHASAVKCHEKTNSSSIYTEEKSIVPRRGIEPRLRR